MLLSLDCLKLSWVSNESKVTPIVLFAQSPAKAAWESSSRKKKKQEDLAFTYEFICKEMHDFCLLQSLLIACGKLLPGIDFLPVIQVY